VPVSAGGAQIGQRELLGLGDEVPEQPHRLGAHEAGTLLGATDVPLDVLIVHHQLEAGQVDRPHRSDLCPNERMIAIADGILLDSGRPGALALLHGERVVGPQAVHLGADAGVGRLAATPFALILALIARVVRLVEVIFGIILLGVSGDDALGRVAQLRGVRADHDEALILIGLGNRPADGGFHLTFGHVAVHEEGHGVVAIVPAVRVVIDGLAVDQVKHAGIATQLEAAGIHVAVEHPAEELVRLHRRAREDDVSRLVPLAIVAEAEHAVGVVGIVLVVAVVLARHGGADEQLRVGDDQRAEALRLVVEVDGEFGGGRGDHDCLLSGRGAWERGGVNRELFKVLPRVVTTGKT
jgi:hypothetical protein